MDGETDEIQIMLVVVRVFSNTLLIDFQSIRLFKTIQFLSIFDFRHKFVLFIPFPSTILLLISICYSPTQYR